jgi:hypothetical protein
MAASNEKFRYLDRARSLSVFGTEVAPRRWQRIMRRLGKNYNLPRARRLREVPMPLAQVPGQQFDALVGRVDRRGHLCARGPPPILPRPNRSTVRA